MVKIRTLPLVFLAGLAFWVSSCAQLQPALPADARLDHHSAIVYGRFSISDRFAFKNKMALWLANLDTQQPVYLFFDAQQPVYAVQIKPGTYHVSGFIGLNRTHKIEGRSELPKLQKPFVAAPDALIYIGDFSGEMDWDGLMISTWNVKSWTNNFVGTTRELREKYPNLGEAPAQSIFTAAPSASAKP